MARRSKRTGAPGTERGRSPSREPGAGGDVGQALEKHRRRWRLRWGFRDWRLWILVAPAWVAFLVLMSLGKRGIILMLGALCLLVTVKLGEVGEATHPSPKRRRPPTPPGPPR